MDSQSILTVRQASVSDLDLLVPMFDAYRQFYRKPADPDLARRFLLERFQNNQSIVFIAELAAPPSGSRSYFQPEARRTGVGSSLLA
jgi:hypothetical protein